MEGYFVPPFLQKACKSDRQFIFIDLIVINHKFTGHLSLLTPL
jgi:hypothetical protein